jgi:hypothetical protein
MTTENRPRIGFGEFTRNALALPDDEFEQAMRSENNDKNINEIKIIAHPLDSYDRN